MTDVNASHYASNKEHQIYNQLVASFVKDNRPIFAGELLARAAHLFGDITALITAEKKLTYKELYAQATALSLHLHTLGVRPRDRVLMLMENSIEFYVVYWAIWQCGAIVVPVNTFLHTHELGHIIRDSQPRLIVTSKKLNATVEKVKEAQDAETFPLVLIEEEIVWKLAPYQGADYIIPLLKPHECALLLYTSGTTGEPKGVMLTSHNIVTNAFQAAARLRMITGEQECFFAVLPLFHAFAQNTCVWLPVASGSSVIVVSKIDRTSIVEGLKFNPTIFFGFPALYGLLCLMKTAVLDSIKLFVSGADAMPDRIRSAFGLLYGRKIASGYGLTEASPVVAINHLNDERPTNNVGIPVVGLEVEIRDVDGQKLAAHEIGTLWIKGGNVMAGYYHAQEATDAILQDGWLCTGDLAAVNAKGEIIIHGRSKDLIIHKGFNIYPQEVENILLKHPAVFKVAVVGREEAASGQVPVAYVALKSRPAAIEQELRTLCSKYLASYKIPRTFVCMDDLPMSPTGKIDKKQLQRVS
jgi:long-chain acyl-CoA synthetase